MITSTTTTNGNSKHLDADDPDLIQREQDQLDRLGTQVPSPKSQVSSAKSHSLPERGNTEALRSALDVPAKRPTKRLPLPIREAVQNASTEGLPDLTGHRWKAKDGRLRPLADPDLGLRLLAIMRALAIYSSGGTGVVYIAVRDAAEATNDPRTQTIWRLLTRQLAPYVQLVKRGNRHVANEYQLQRELFT